MGRQDKVFGELKKERNSNFELLRIISMYMIVLIHANIYLGEFDGGTIAARIYNGVVNGICNTGVSLFILISGYFGVSFNIKKLTRLECKMITYSLIVMGLSLFIYGETMTSGDKLELLGKSLLPFASRNHWFYSCYVLIVLFSGFIEKLIGTMDKKSFGVFLGLMLFCFSVLPTCIYFEIMQDNGKGLVQMFMIYMIGRYIRKYGSDFGREHKKLIIGCFVATWIVNLISFNNPIKVGGIYHTLCKDNSTTNMILAVSLFYLFKDIKIRSKYINVVAYYMFAVFAMNYVLISMTVDFIRDKLPMLTSLGEFGYLMIPAIALLVLVVCVLVGVIRDFLLGCVDVVIAERVERLFEVA